MELIRETLPEDAAQVAACITSIAGERRWIACTQGYSAQDAREFILALQQVGGVHLVVMFASLVVGWCEITPGLFEGMATSGYLTMGLIPEVRGRGWGRKLLEAALNLAFTQRHFERVEIEVFSSNTRAIALYQKIGCTQEGYKRKVRILNKSQEDMVVFGVLKEEWITRRSTS